MATKLEQLREAARIANAALEEEERRVNGPMTLLATTLHSHFCRYNHTDGCSWEYESGDGQWQGHAHSRWLETARKVMPVITEGFNTVEEYAAIHVDAFLTAVKEAMR